MLDLHRTVVGASLHHFVDLPVEEINRDRQSYVLLKGQKAGRFVAGCATGIAEQKDSVAFIHARWSNLNESLWLVGNVVGCIRC